MGLLCAAALLGCATTGGVEGEVASASSEAPRGPGCDPDAYAWACELVPTRESDWPWAMETLRTTAGTWRQLFRSLSERRTERVLVRRVGELDGELDGDELVAELTVDARGRVTRVQRGDSTFELRWDEDGLVGTTRSAGPSTTTRTFVADGSRCRAEQPRHESEQPVRYVCAIDEQHRITVAYADQPPTISSERDGALVRVRRVGSVDELRFDDQGRIESWVTTVGSDTRTSREVERTDGRVEVRTRSDMGAMGSFLRETIHLGADGLPERVERNRDVFRFEYVSR
ncbi:MAG: hypothetical protein MUE69_26415 [Myxococcota bacterium]|nr:hypothetical protein [Myxococcota bacterium]